MFINFDPDNEAHCDNCGVLGTVMHLLVLRSDRGVDLCTNCFGAMALAITHAARKLKLSADSFAFDQAGAATGA